MSTITDWLMLVLTGVYVIATIVICNANLKSAKATRDQLSEMRHEHEENLRLSVMPYFEVNFKKFNPEIHESPAMFYSFTQHREEQDDEIVLPTNLNIKNIGMNLAGSIVVGVEYGDFRVRGGIINLTIHPGKESHLKFFNYVHLSEVDHDIFDPEKEAKLVLEFNDILGNHYSQAVQVWFRIYRRIKLSELGIQVDDEEDEEEKYYASIWRTLTYPPIFEGKASEVQYV